MVNLNLSRGYAVGIFDMVSSSLTICPFIAKFIMNEYFLMDLQNCSWIKVFTFNLFRVDEFQMVI